MDDPELKVLELEGDVSDLESKVSELGSNLQLAGEAIGGLLWLIEGLAESGGVTFGKDEADVVDRVDQIAHLL